ncbi:flagellar hook-length control protein FliK [Uliginosibacterium aquaticum]|uniref:Flagellar hook-length control protein FliK n=1 Tax=Uliginosibacterium aquaticum TaxID=2731212 RepID=A0ABX2IEV2_9RHOO|nr:flagellar hook-length control protein FliK [Uliginosibacterium aquaticum]NSL55184.1 flagellar hook-length control protein FliK [Uliginosibacterium aquaticum]
MIPGDLASRLRVLLEASIQPISVAHEIAPDLPRLQPGQRITALIESPLPDGSFRALVAGKTITLALPESAKSGDSLELLVTGQRGGTVHARLAPAAETPPADGDELPRTALSKTGQLISQLITGRHGEARPQALNRGEPLLPATQTPRAATLAPVLQQAVSQSGVFYEAHLRQWVEGKRSLASLLAEPQAAGMPESEGGETTTSGLLPRTASSTAAAPTAPPASSAGSPAQASANPQAPTGVAQALNSQTTPDTERERETSALRVATGTTAANATDNTAPARTADPITPVMLQQLEALASNQLSWQGQAWPGMQLQWSLVDPESESPQRGEADQGQVWRSNLRVDLPALGGIQARLLLGPQGLSLLIDTDRADTAEKMRAAQPALQASLEAAGLDPRHITVSEHVSA